MRVAAAAVAVAAVAALSLPAAALAHGPLPESTAATGEPPSVVRTTHGIVWNDGDWRWLCPEVFAPAFADDPFQLPSGRVLVGTTQGIRWTDDGCTWSWAEGVESYVAQIERDDTGRLWGLTQSALIRSDDDGAEWLVVDEVQEGASLRAFVRWPNRWAVAGWSATGPAVLWVGAPGEAWTQAALPIDVSHLMEPLGLGPEGKAWFNYPFLGIGSILRVSEAGVVELVVEAIGDVAGLVVEDGLPLIGTRDGLLRSEDGGATWTMVNAAGLNWLGDSTDGWIGCFDARAGVGSVAQWTGSGWHTLLELEEVVGPMDCPTPTDGSAEACAEEWETVHAAFLLGTDPPRSQASDPAADPPQEQNSGCSYSSRSSSTWWLLLVACMARQRRRAPARSA